jgi:hypothetical protein
MAAVSAPAKEYTSALTAFDQSKPPKASAAEVGRAAAGAASDAPEHQEGYRDGCGGKERRHHVDPPGQRTQWHFGEAERNEHVQRIARRMGCASLIRYTPNATIHSPSAAITSSAGARRDSGRLAPSLDALVMLSLAASSVRHPYKKQARRRCRASDSRPIGRGE